jgi:hypothetical protein
MRQFVYGQVVIAIGIVLKADGLIFLVPRGNKLFATDDAVFVGINFAHGRGSSLPNPWR